jgi:hypothetical protein
VSAPAADGARSMRIYDDTDNDGVFSSSSDEIVDTQIVPSDLVISAPPASAAYRSWPATSTSNTFIIECDIQGRAIDPPNSSTNGSTTTGVAITRPAVLSITHKEMGAGGTLRPDISYFLNVNLLWQPSIQKWVNGKRMS